MEDGDDWIGWARRISPAQVGQKLAAGIDTQMCLLLSGSPVTSQRLAVRARKKAPPKIHPIP
jgi:hypothetical protein